MFIQVVAIRDIIPPPQREVFNDVYIAYELMDTDLHQIIRSNQALSEEHCQVLSLHPLLIDSMNLLYCLSCIIVKAISIEVKEYFIYNRTKRNKCLLENKLSGKCVAVDSNRMLIILQSLTMMEIFNVEAFSGKKARKDMLS